MQGCVSASRNSLGNSWLQAYLTAPIWRFWLGADICGATVVGALMSSLDGVGRYYPLTLFACADPERSSHRPTSMLTMDGLRRPKNFLLFNAGRQSHLRSDYKRPRSALRTHHPKRRVHRRRTCRSSSSGVMASPRAMGFSGLLGCFAPPIIPGAYAAASFWWTTGGAITSRSDFAAGYARPVLSRSC